VKLGSYSDRSAAWMDDLLGPASPEGLMRGVENLDEIVA
jgi:hypothetical protein